MKFPLHTQILAGRPDVVPFVNVTLLLLLFFIIAMRYVQEPGVSFQLPAAVGTAPSPAVAQPPLTVTISAENPDTHVNSIYFNDEIVDLPKLGSLLAEEVRRSPHRECVVRADKSAPHGLVVTILELAQQAGLKTVRLATQSPEAAAPGRKP